MDGYFPKSYEASRARFLRQAEALGARWPAARLEAYRLKEHPGLSIDWLWALPPVKESLFMVSTGEHGIEGYVGSAILKLFMEEFAPRLDAGRCGLLLVHAINPWGMKHRLRVNPNNVDLNRNFILGGKYEPMINPDYGALDDFLNPRRAVRPLEAEAAPFLIKAAAKMLSLGRRRVQAAALLGQHRRADGIYFGGSQAQEETLALMGLYRSALEQFETCLQVDVHSGYGPRYQMSVIVPPQEPRSSAQAARRFDYPLVQKIDAQEFYAISGDMGEYVYRLREAEFPNKRVFACGFEFGTFGDSLPALIRSLRITILENQLRQHGAASPQAEAQVLAEYEELFLPSEARWREKALEDGRKAFEGILGAYGLV
jgi:hypothetical protein